MDLGAFSFNSMVNDILMKLFLDKVINDCWEFKIMNFSNLECKIGCSSWYEILSAGILELNDSKSGSGRKKTSRKL